MIKILNLSLDDINKLIQNRKDLNFENKTWKVKDGFLKLKSFDFKKLS